MPPAGKVTLREITRTVSTRGVWAAEGCDLSASLRLLAATAIEANAEIKPWLLTGREELCQVAKGNLRTTRTALPGQTKGSSSPRLHYHQQQGVDSGGKVRRPEDLGSTQCGPAQICPTCCQKTNSPQARVPGACSSALKGARGSEPQLGTANQHLHRQPAPKHLH